MKIRFTGPLRNDGTYPNILIGETFVDMVDGTVDVSNEAGEALLATGNFEAVVVAPAPKPGKLSKPVIE